MPTTRQPLSARLSGLSGKDCFSASPWDFGPEVSPAWALYLARSLSALRGFLLASPTPGRPPGLRGRASGHGAPYPESGWGGAVGTQGEAVNFGFGGTTTGVLDAQHLTGVGKSCPNLAQPRRKKSGRSPWEGPRAARARATGPLDPRARFAGHLGLRGRTVTKESRGKSLLRELATHWPQTSFGGHPEPPFRRPQPRCHHASGSSARPSEQPGVWAWSLEGFKAATAELLHWTRGAPTAAEGATSRRAPVPQAPRLDIGRSSPPAPAQLLAGHGLPRAPLSLLGPPFPCSARASSAIEMQIVANCRRARRHPEPDPSAASHQTFGLRKLSTEK